METLRSGYCQGCGRLLAIADDHRALCPPCHDGGAARAPALLPTAAESALLATVDFVAAMRLRSLRRRVRTGRLAD